MATRSLSDARKLFVGVWTLESFTERSDASEEFYPLGEKPVGLLIYTADGFVSAQLMKPDRQELKTDPWVFEESKEGGDLTRGYIAYCGSYEVYEERGQVIHRPTVALLPNLINQEQHRSFKFESDTLTLVTTRKRVTGNVVESSLTWRRCR